MRNRSIANPLERLVSFGNNAKRPHLLETRPTSQALDGIRDGEWRDGVERVRRLPYRTPEQRREKLKLPFVTWSGEFAYRKGDCLIRHSGQVGIDVDHLTPDECLKVIARAVRDRYCLAAFHS